MTERFEEDGAVLVPGLLTPNECAALIANIESLEAEESDRETLTRIGGFQDRHLWPVHDWMRELCLRDDIGEVAARLMKSRSARLYFDHVFVRDAGTRTTSPWHQDRPYWPFRGRQILSIWISLTDSDAASSGLQFIRGSHRWSVVYRPVVFDEEDTDVFIGEAEAGEIMPDFDADPAKYRTLHWDMKAGDAIAFGGEVLHGAKPNDSETKRRLALSIRYLGDDARWDPRPGTDPIVGTDDVCIEPGDPPHDDRWFPVVWRAG